MEGWLNKKGGEKGFRQWKKRYCVINDSENLFLYYEDNTMKNKKGEVDIGLCLVELVDHRERSFVFVLKTQNSEPIYLQADDNVTMSKWMRAIEGESSSVTADEISRINAHVAEAEQQNSDEEQQLQ